ncbi:hypothetical protein PX554_18095 [Sphingomonas sp. H39-1-10]|uniref:hypothetical protein n=1 Tax=Sphingomonas pollutisoli TaxID=3030829 RepID=UPI0023BA2FF9|nr:hypothetical protein [Sphingomonas pollutisoli]MDF0490049.1 hypothetical protein [Sphingomonas pollutisoli]
MIYSGDDKWDTMKKILQAGMGEPLALGARISCLVNAPKVSLANIAVDDVIGAASVAGTQPRRNRINTITPRFRLEENNWQLLPGTPISVAEYVLADRGKRSKVQDYPFIQQTPQVATAVRYDIENAREFGPITLPLKLVWMGYKPGDCVTVTLPEVGLNAQPVLLLNRELDPSQGVVTMTARSETAAKHPYALGQTTTPPPTPGLTGPPLIPVPGANAWAITATSIQSSSGTVPALVIEGARDASAIDGIVFDYRKFTTGLGPDDGWITAGIEPPSATAKVIASVEATVPYQVSVRYSRSSRNGGRLILGPVGTDALEVALVPPGAAIGGTVGPGGEVVGGIPARTFVDALAELASSPDPDKQIEGAKGLVDRTRETALTQIKNQLLAFARKTRTDSATHLDGIPMGARVRTEITERIEQGLALAQQIVEVEAAITGPNGPIAAAVTQLTQAIADGDHAQALALQALDAAITGPDGPIAAAVTQLTQAVADANSARAEAFDQLQAAITANGDALDAAFTQLNQAVVTEHDARVQADTDLKAEITGPSGPIAAAVSQLNLALATQQSATAQMIADLQASITGPQGALTGEVARLDQAIADEAGVRASSITTLKSTVDGQTASIDVLFETINGQQAIAQIAVTVDDNGAPVMTGLKINGQEHLFAIAADRFVVGNSLIFEVDSTTGTVYMNNVVVGRLKAQSVTTDALVDNSVTGFTSISGLTGELDSTLTSTISDVFYVPSHYGKVMRLDVNLNITLIPGQNPNFFMQLYRDGGPISRAFQLNSTSATNGGFPAFFTLIDNPPPGTHGYQLFFSRYTPISGGGATAAGIRYTYGEIYAQEFYK